MLKLLIEYCNIVMIMLLNCLYFFPVITLNILKLLSFTLFNIESDNVICYNVYRSLFYLKKYTPILYY